MSQLRMVDEFMSRLAFKSNVDVDKLCPADHIDLIGGVGFGGNDGRDRGQTSRLNQFPPLNVEEIVKLHEQCQNFWRWTYDNITLQTFTMPNNLSGWKEGYRQAMDLMKPIIMGMGLYFQIHRDKEEMYNIIMKSVLLIKQRQMMGTHLLFSLQTIDETINYFRSRQQQFQARIQERVRSLPGIPPVLAPLINPSDHDFSTLGGLLPPATLAPAQPTPIGRTTPVPPVAVPTPAPLIKPSYEDYSSLGGLLPLSAQNRTPQPGMTPMNNSPPEQNARVKDNFTKFLSMQSVDPTVIIAGRQIELWDLWHAARRYYTMGQPLNHAAKWHMVGAHLGLPIDTQPGHTIPKELQEHHARVSVALQSARMNPQAQPPHQTAQMNAMMLQTTIKNYPHVDFSGITQDIIVNLPIPRFEQRIRTCIAERTGTHPVTASNPLRLPVDTQSGHTFTRLQEYHARVSTPPQGDSDVQAIVLGSYVFN